MNLQQTKKFSLSFFLLMLLAAGAFAQARPVTGQVTDIEGKPVPGVTVIVKGTAGNVITDKEGKFKVMATPEQTIEFTHIAYASKEVKVGAHPTIDVMLSKADSQMDDVIVIGYGTQRQKNITGSVVPVNLTKLGDQPVATVAEALRGQVPGLAVQGGGTRPGLMPTVTVRQQFNWGKDGGNANPLIVIDDVIQVDPSTGLSSLDRFNQLDLSEVESITVLRDAAAAIYGSRASQGAIVIKTKRGKIGPPKINYAGKFETNDAISHGKVQNAYDFGVFENRFGRALGWTKDQLFSDNELERMKSMNYDWLSPAWKAANAMQHSLTVSGGSDRATYFTGGSYYTQGANMGSQDYKKYTFRAGTDVTVASGLKLSATLNANNSNLEKSFTKINVNDGSYGVGGEQMDYSTLLHMPKYIPVTTNIGGKDYYISPNLSNKTLGTVAGNNSMANTNYYALLNNGSQTNTKYFNYSANVGLQYELPFIKGLSVKATYAIQSYSSNTEQVMNQVTLVKNKSGNLAEHHLYDTAAVWDNPAVNKNNSRVSYDNQTGTTEQMNFYLNYDHTFGDHSISIVAAGERAKNTWDDRLIYYDQPLIGVYNGTSVTAGTINSDNTITYRQENGQLSYLGRISYAFKSRYLLQFLFRADASSRFAPENYWGKFPTVSAGWVISDEDWFRDQVPFVNFLKLRTSWGITGNDNVKPWKWMQLYKIESAKGMAFGTSNGGNYTYGITPEVAPNRDVKWDKTFQRNFGLDFAMLRNRLSVNIDQYYNTYSDVLTAMAGAVGVPISVGGGFAEQNYSGLNSWGTEISATWKDRIANKVDYSVNMNFGIGNYKTTKYYDQAFDYPAAMNKRTAVGNYGAPGIWGYKTWTHTSSGDGILRTDDDVNNYWQYLTDNANKSGVAGAAPNYMGITAMSGLKKGMVAYEDVRGQLNTADKSYAGPNGMIDNNSTQDQVLLKKNSKTYGINTNLSFSYNGISLSAQLVTSWGGYNKIDYIKNATSSTAMLWGQPIIMNDMYDSTDNPNGKYPNLAYYDNFGGTNSDASFWKVSSFRMYLRTLSIGYTLPKSFVRRARIDNARVYLSGNNLWDFYNPYPNHYRNMYDAPNVLYPTLRTWALGVNLGF